MGNTAIEWCDKVWNPVTGCTKVSAGCKHCYAKQLHDMRNQAYLDGKRVPKQYRVPFEAVQLHPSRLEDPLRWRKPQRVFVNSMSDLFHPDVPDTFIQSVFSIMENAKHHTFMVLTKRPERMLSWIKGYDQWLYHAGTLPFINRHPNVWLGVSVENQQAADERTPLLQQTPAAVRFISAEPLLGPVDLEPYLQYPPFTENYKLTFGQTEWRGIDWVICGGESGPGARPMNPNWARGLLDECLVTGTPFFFKQWGEWLPDDQMYSINRRDPMTETDMTWVRVGKKAAGRQLDGKEWNEFPEVK